MIYGERVKAVDSFLRESGFDVSRALIPVARSVNVFQRQTKQRECPFLTKARRLIAKNRLLMKILQKFDHCSITTFRKAPFDFVITVPENRMEIIGGVAGNPEPDLETRAAEILNVCRVVQAHPIFITDRQEL